METALHFAGAVHLSDKRGEGFGAKSVQNLDANADQTRSRVNHERRGDLAEQRAIGIRARSGQFVIEGLGFSFRTAMDHGEAVTASGIAADIIESLERQGLRLQTSRGPR